MSGLVDQLQADALDTNASISALLRKVKIAAVKLSLDDALGWVQRELDGYKDKNDLPSYREVRGNPVGWNPYHGWQPMMFGDERIDEMVSEVTLFDPIGLYESMLQKGEAPTLLKPLPPGLVVQINNITGWNIPKAAIEFPKGALTNIVDQVRNLVLDWALELARAGITGEGISFTVEERNRAAGAQIHIGQLNGSFRSGDAIGSNARINMASTDRSSNVAAERSIFRDIEAATRENVSDRALAEALLSANREMEQAKDGPSLLSAYKRFIGLAADHIGVFGPMLPALASLLSS